MFNVIWRLKCLVSCGEGTRLKEAASFTIIPEISFFFAKQDVPFDFITLTVFVACFKAPQGSSRYSVKH